MSTERDGRDELTPDETRALADYIVTGVRPEPPGGYWDDVDAAVAHARDRGLIPTDEGDAEDAGARAEARAIVDEILGVPDPTGPHFDDVSAALADARARGGLVDEDAAQARIDAEADEAGARKAEEDRKAEEVRDIMDRTADETRDEREKEQREQWSGLDRWS